MLHTKVNEVSFEDSTGGLESNLSAWENPPHSILRGTAASSSRDDEEDIRSGSRSTKAGSQTPRIRSSIDGASSTATSSRKGKKSKSAKSKIKNNVVVESDKEVVLKILCATRRNSLAEYRARAQKLQQENFHLKSRLEELDRKSNGYINGLLIQSKKNHNAMESVRSHNSDQLLDATDELDDMWNRLNDFTEVMASDEERLRVVLRSKAMHLELLRKYEGHEQGEIMLQMENLQHKLDNLHFQQEEEIQHLIAEFAMDREGKQALWDAQELDVQREASRRVLAAGITTEMISMIADNNSKHQEILTHTSEVNNLNSRIEKLERENEELRERNKEVNIDIRKAGLLRKKCDPNEELVLNINTEAVFLKDAFLLAEKKLEEKKNKLLKLFSVLDKNGDGSVEITEFVLRTPVSIRENFATVFKAFDTDGSGDVTADEFVEAFLRTTADPILMQWASIFEKEMALTN